MKRYFTYLFLGILLLTSSKGFSQLIEPTHVFGTDIIEFKDAPSYSIDEGRKYNAPEFYTHPDFGKLTFRTPEGKNVVEDLSKRKSDERYYVDLDDPTYFYIQKSAVPINIYEEGYWRAIDPSLHLEESGKYRSGYQPYPTALNTHLGYTTITTPEGDVSFNNFRLKRVYNDNSFDVITANWTNVKVTNFDCEVTDIFPGIDLVIKFSERKIKSDFIIKHDLNLKSLVFIDDLELPSNFDLLIENSADLNLKHVQIYDMNTAENVIVVDPARSHDNSGSKESWFCDYVLAGDELHIVLDSNQLNKSGLVYPLTIDPTFVAVGPVAAGFPVMGSLVYPAACTDVINVNFPGGSTPWDVDADATIFADFCAATVFFPPTMDCWASELGFWVTSGCGGISPAGAPGTTWGCTVPACNAPGGWILGTGFNASGTQSLAQCYAPSCANQVMTFTINFSRSWCPTYSGYDDCDWNDSYCESLDDWSVTVQGRSSETLGNTATGNGSTNIYDADCAGTQNLDPTPLYGVPGYTYSWNPGGATSPTLTVPGTVSTYTVDVTDACGNTVTATFDIGCPLSIDLKSFTADKLNESVLVKWESAVEHGINSYELQHSVDGENWLTIETTDALGNSDEGGQYQFIHHEPNQGKNYYRLKTNLESGSFEYSEIIELEFYSEFSMYPNPASNSVHLIFENEVKAGTYIILNDLFGREVLKQYVYGQKMEIDLIGLMAGNYILSVYTDDQLVAYKRLAVNQ